MKSSKDREKLKTKILKSREWYLEVPQRERHEERRKEEKDYT